MILSTLTSGMTPASVVNGWRPMKPATLSRYRVHMSRSQRRRRRPGPAFLHPLLRQRTPQHRRGATGGLVRGASNLGVMDGFATVRHGNTQRSAWFSDALESHSLELAVGGYRIEVIEPLRSLRVVCEPVPAGGWLVEVETLLRSHAAWARATSATRRHTAAG